jgi:quinol-cytochrome oxidoreductase complex cytochrome b subunit
MNLEKLEAVVSRVFFYGAFLLFVFALIERAVGVFGFQIQHEIRAVTLMQTAAVLLIFVIAIQLRAIREALARKP